MPRSARIAWIVCFIAIAGIGLLALNHQPVSAPTEIATAIPLGGSFELIDQNGHKVTEKSWPGKYLVYYFGFTHCPDVCPTGLNKLIAAINILPADQQTKLQPLLVTVDPARDKAEDLKIYTEIFDKRLIGLTGTESQIEHIKKLFKVYAQKQGDGPDYMVNHSAFTYLQAPDGQLVGLFSHDISAEDMAQKISQALQK